MSKIYSIDSDNLSPLGGATTRDLDPFGTATNESLGLFGGAGISELYPYYLTITPDYIYNLPDSIALSISKNVVGSDFASPSDDIANIVFNKGLFDLPIASDQIQSFDVTKLLKDTQLALDRPYLHLTKLTSDVVDSFEDKSTLQFTKSLATLLPSPTDEIQSFTFGKSLFDLPIASDQIQSFSVIKLLQDFANPVDLVNIPDGATFQFNKTLRNTVDQIIDDQSFVFNKVLKTEQAIDEKAYLHVEKPFYDIVTNDDFSTISFIKALFTDVLVNESVVFSFLKSESDTFVANDFSTISFVKSLADIVDQVDDAITQKAFEKSLFSDQLVDDAIQSFSVNKVLQDFANPVDLVGIPDGTTFQFVKTLRNTVDNITDSILLYWTFYRSFSDTVENINDNSVLHIGKTLFDYQSLTDQIQNIVFGKTLSDSQSTADSLNISFSKVLSSISVVEDKKYLHVSKTFSDNFDNEAIRYTALTQNVDLNNAPNTVLDFSDLDYGFIDFNTGVFLLPTSTIVDELVSVNLGKGLFDSVSNADAIQSFSVIKVLQDFANPVDFVGIPDGTTFQLIKTLRNTVLPQDEARLYWQFNRFFDHSVSTSDLITFIALGKNFTEEVYSDDQLQTIVVNKLLNEYLQADDAPQLSLSKPIDNFVSATDVSSWNVDKPFFNDVLTSDTNVLSVAKLINEEIIADESTAFDITKLLQDFANPVDLVNIPDGTTFQLVKTLRNTVNLLDEAKLYWQFSRSPLDLVNVNDLTAFDFTKVLQDKAVTVDLAKKSFTKTLTDFVSALDKIIFGRSLNEQDTNVILDKSTFTLAKNLSHSVSLQDVNTLDFNKALTDIQIVNDQVQSFAVTKLLEDFANPVDFVGIPDGTTFQLIKTLRNTVLLQDVASLVWYFNRSFNDLQYVTDYSVLSVGKQLSNDVSSTDQLQTINVDKSLTDDNIVLDTSSLSVYKPISDLYTVQDQSALSFTKIVNDLTFADDLLSTITLGKSLSEILNFTDEQTFAVTKSLQDFANPVDLVGIPDGTTFQFNKTLRNTVLPSDQTSLYWQFNRSFDHSIISDDKIQSFVFNKVLTDFVKALDDANIKSANASDITDLASTIDVTSLLFNKLLSDTNISPLDEAELYWQFNRSFDHVIVSNDSIKSFTFNKVLTDFVSVLDQLTTSGIEADQYSDFTNVNDKSSLHPTKVLKDKLGDSTYLSLNNNLDFNITSGTYDIDDQNGIIDLETTNFYIDGIIFDETTLAISKFINENNTLTDKAKLSFIKLLSDKGVILDVNYLNFRKRLFETVSSSDAILGKTLNKKLFDQILVLDTANLQETGAISVQNGDSSVIEDSGYLRMTDYADISYFAEDYVGESRSFT